MSTPEYRRIQSRKHHLKRLARGRAIRDAAKDVPCADCGHRYPPYVMEFDHLPGTGKVEAVSKLVHATASAMHREIAKCEVVCANCHRERTHARSWEGPPPGP